MGNCCSSPLGAGGTHLDTTAARVASIVGDALSAEGVPHTVQSAGSLFSVFFRADPVVDYDTARLQDASAYATFFHAMLDEGVWLPPSAFEAWFVSTALDDEDFATIERAAVIAARACAA